MKKLTAKLRRQKPEEEKPSRITNETVAEHREQILAGGRKFKYPVQYAKHKLVLNSSPADDAAIEASFAAVWASDDVRESAAARDEKRPPIFRGR